MFQNSFIFRHLRKEVGKPAKKPLIGDKDLFTVDETARYYLLSRRKLTQFLNQDEDYPFIVFFRKRKLIIRDEFDVYMENHPELKKERKNARTTEPETP